MSVFLGEDYLLVNNTSKKIYEEIKSLPFFDIHSHVDINQLADNKNFEDIWQVEGQTDHYVWELMRRRGVEEKFITGRTTNKEKWFKLASVFPDFVGNPLYEWIHLDLRRNLNINEEISAETAEKIWNESKEILKKDELKPINIIKNANIKKMCIVSDVLDNLDNFKKVNAPYKILPVFRTDKVYNIEKDDFINFSNILCKKFNQNETTFDGYLDALSKALSYFKEFGCQVSDQGLFIPYGHYVTKNRAKEIYVKRMSNKALKNEEMADYKAFMLFYLGELYSENNFTAQYHIGAVRDYRKSLFDMLGPDSGGDISTNNLGIAMSLKNFLNAFDGKFNIILYVVDPFHLPSIATLSRAYPNVLIGAPWWFNDSPFGIEFCFKYISSVDLLFNFSGFTTDSRKIISFGSRIELFRRVLSSVMGEFVEKGQIPYNRALEVAKRVSSKDILE
jgi:glucuronate isomerase